jgi:DNA repair exonuclease SbcCD nuclease subunit
MKIAFVTDTHFGYRRFEQDAYSQGKQAILDAASEADAIILGGDNFDTPLPRMETLSQVTGILREAQSIHASRGITGVQVFAIHGNHDRRAKGFVHPTELLAHGGFLVNVHNRTVVVEGREGPVAISGMGNVPDDLASEAVKHLECKPVEGAFNIFVLHQTFRETGFGNESFISYDELPEGYDLYLCGHIHKPSLGGKVQNPGSTVATILHEDEAGQRGWLLYDTDLKKAEFRQINSREFHYSALTFENATPEDVRSGAEAEAKRLAALAKSPSALVKVVVKGTLAKGFSPSDMRLPAQADGVYFDNQMNFESLKGKIEQIKITRERKLSAQQQGMEILRRKLEGTPYTLGDPERLFESLLEGSALAEIRENIAKEPAK